MHKMEAAPLLLPFNPNLTRHIRSCPTTQLPQALPKRKSVLAIQTIVATAMLRNNEIISTNWLLNNFDHSHYQCQRHCRPDQLRDYSHWVTSSSPFHQMGSQRISIRCRNPRHKRTILRWGIGRKKQHRKQLLMIF